MAAIEMFFDIGSPYTYIAMHRVEGMAQRAGVSVAYRPFLLGGVFKATGNVMPATVPARAQYMLSDLKRWAHRSGIPFQFPMFFPINSLLPMRALSTFPFEEVRSPAMRVFDAYWGENRDVSDPSVLAELIGADAVGQASDPEVKGRLRVTTEDAVARGAFGAPTFFVGDQMFFGNDRLDFVEEAARQA